MRLGYNPIKVIVVKKNKLGVPRLEKVYDSGHEPLDEDELKAYQTLFGMRENEKKERRVSHPPNLHPHRHHRRRRMLTVLLKS